MFSFESGEYYSLGAVKEFSDAGGSVLRSAHIGNFDPATLMLAQEGFSILLHEHIHGSFKGYEPGFIRKDGKRLKIAEGELDKLICHSRPIEHAKMNSVVGLNGYDTQTPFYTHYSSLKQLYPTNVSSASEFLLEQEPFLLDMISVLSQEFKHFFHKYADENGNIFNYSREKGSQIIYQQVNGEVEISSSTLAGYSLDYLKAVSSLREKNHDPVNIPGAIMNSSLYIVLATICDLYKGRKGTERYSNDSTVMHFSGAEMTNYLLSNPASAVRLQSEINSIYSYLHKEFSSRLPNSVRFILIPTRIYKHYIKLSVEAERTDRIGEFKDIHNFTQYDLAGRSIHIPSIILTTVYKDLNKLRRNELRKQKIRIKKPALSRMTRHISYCVPKTYSDERILADIDAFFSNSSHSLFDRKIIERITYNNLAENVSSRLGANEELDNILVEVVFGNEHNSLSKQEAIDICLAFMHALHQGKRQ